MAPIAKAMTPPQRTAAAAYYASLGASAPAATAAAAVATTSPGTNSVSSSGTRQAGAAGNDRGRQLAMWGDEGKVVQACANCHGPEGTGEGREFPYLAGQSAAYLTAALTAWRDGSRRSDPSGQMPLIAKSLADADVQAVAAYYAGLPAPSAPLDAAAPPAAPASGATTVVSGPRPGAQAPQGVGTQQGSLTGGVQGPGGGGAGTGGGPGGSTTGESAVAPASGASR